MSTENLREAQEADLIGRIRYNDPDVFRRLRISDIDDELVGGCIKWLNTTQKDDIKVLKHLARISDSPAFKHRSRIYHKGWEGATVSVDLKEIEDEMYEPLIHLMTEITLRSGTATGLVPKRVFRRAYDMRQDLLFPNTCTRQAPDMECVTVEGSKKYTRTWDVREFFVEVKPSSKDGPNGRTPDIIPDIVLESTEQAVQLMSNRPFLLFCTGLLIFGTKFCVGIFDHDGVLFSSVYDLFGNMDVFVRVVRSLTCLLSIQELGFDPTVRMLSDDETETLTGKKQDCPSAIVTVPSIGQPSTEWCTIGRPIWLLSDLFGRGTNVWRVRRYRASKNTENAGLDDAQMVLQTSWRSSMRNSESDVYHHLNSILPNVIGLPKLECGGDVVFPDSEAPITVQNLRNYPNCANTISKSRPTPVRHRVVLNNAGDRLWNYENDLQLLRAFRDALLVISSSTFYFFGVVQAEKAGKRHKSLSDRNILHRDISPGSVLLNRSADVNGSYGLVSNFTFVRLDMREILALRVSQQKVSEVSIPVLRGAPMTGGVNCHFIAREFLKPEIDTGPEARHDIESFIWVLLHAIMQRIVEKGFSDPHFSRRLKDEHNEFLYLYDAAFSARSYETIVASRQVDSAILTFVSPEFFPETRRLVERFVSKPLRDLIFVEFRGFLTRDPVDLTYETVLEPVRAAIRQLESDPAEPPV